MVQIVLDANIIIAEGFGRSALFRFLLSSAMAVDCKLAVPELVVEEVVSKFAKTMNDEVRAARRNLGKLSRLLTRPAPSFIDEIDHENEVESFRKA